jgi:PAS domain S-box-containing protein
MPLRHLPLQRRLVGFILLTSLSVLLLSYLPLLIYETRSSYQTTRGNLSTVGEIIASNSTAALIYDDQTFAAELLATLKAEPDVISAALFDKDGKVFAAYQANHGRTAVPALPHADGLEVGQDEVTLFRPVNQGNARVGTLFIRSDLGAMYGRLRIYGSVLLGVLVGAGVLAFFLSNFLQRQISGPILDLAETARTISERKDYSVRATKSGGDELGFVTEAFNSMLEQIELNHAVLGESEERFRAVADNAPVLIWLAGPDKLCTWINQHYLEFVGLPPRSEVGGVWRNHLHPDDRERAASIYDASFDARVSFRIEYRLRRHDGVYRWLLDHGAPRYQGETFVGYIGSCVDITERKEAEALVRSSELQMRLVTDHAAVFLCHLDRNHRFKFANRAYAARYGREPQDLIGRHLAEIIGPAAYETARAKLASAIAGHREEFELEMPYATLGRRTVHYIYEPERNANGEVAGLVAVLTDITERRKAEQELSRARDVAVAASRAKDDFLAALSHELRTPLNPVLLLASDAAANPELPSAIRADFETIRKNVELEARLIDDLLDLTRITRGKLTLDLRLVDVHPIINDTVATVSREIQAKRISLVLQLPPVPIQIRADPVRLQQVLWNVLKNAVKFTPEGGRITLADEWLPGSRTLVIRVSDTGIGMVPGELERIFDAFAQGDHMGEEAHRFGGLGLGLAISRRIVELHHGRITASSPGRNRGSVFTIELPGVKPHADRPPTANPPELPPPAPASTPGEPAGAPAGRRTILLVEDHAPTRLALESLLKRRKYHVAVAGTVAEARAIAEKGDIDVVISDIGLPDGSGFDLMAELKSRFGLKGIALTGYGMENDLIRSGEAGFVTHLTKPIRMQSLDEALAALFS